MSKANSVLDLIGNTPHVKINRLFGENSNVYVKLEKCNPFGSIKDRIALEMIEDAEAKGTITPGKSTIIEVTSGNTGVALSAICAVKGYRCIIIMPTSMSEERKRLIRIYGAELILTDASGGMAAAMKKKDEVLQILGENGYWLNQFKNPSNIVAHSKHTVKEIEEAFKDDGLDYIVAGIGTGGHISAIGENLKKAFPNLKVIGIQPASAPIFTEGVGAMKPHKIAGITAGFIPDNFHREAVDEILSVTNEDAYAMARRSAKEEGLLVGISSSACLSATEQILKRAPFAKILCFTYDSGERYLSIDDLWSVVGM